MTILFPSSKESKELARMYGYKEWMIARFMNYIPDLESFLASIDRFRHRYIRINTLRNGMDYIKSRLEQKFTLKPTILDEVYEVTDAKISLGASLEYLLGYYYIQDLSSCLAVKALDPKPNEHAIDLCSAPGGKTTYIAQLMNNQGLLVAIEASKERLVSLLFNIQRCNVMNAYVFNMDARYAHTLGLRYDKILLDAPCSCEGVIARDMERRYNREPRDIDYCSNMQRLLIDEAIRIAKPDSIIVYSTCSFAPEEDEAIIDYAIKRYDVDVEPLPFGYEGLSKFGELEFDHKVRNARRLYPHIHNTLGFFIARLKVHQ